MGELSISKKEILSGLEYEVVLGEVDGVLVEDVLHDTRKIEKNVAFVCIVGERVDSHSMIKDIVDKGSTLIVIEHDLKEEDLSYIKEHGDVTLIKVKDTRFALSKLSINYFRNPSKDMCVVGVTGTKGKTSTSMIVKQTLENLGISCGLIGTIGVFIGDELIKTDNTTPESYLIQKYFYMMRKKGFKYVCMEVSSQSVLQKRVSGIHFSIALWINIFEDHIGPGEHKDFEDYFNCKLEIFDNASFAIINKNTNRLNDIIKRCEKNNLQYEMFDLGEATYKNYETDKYFGVKFTLEGVDKEFDLSLPGEYNVENTIAAIKVLTHIGIDVEDIRKNLDKISIPGRTEVVFKDDDMIVMVDFAHNALGTQHLMETMRQYHKKRYVVVFGCGGGRDKERRYGMGRACGETADFCIVTADNSRYEKTMDIIEDILSVLKKYTSNYITFEYRRDAIEYAITHHEKGDIIMVIGKGHEDYNDFNGVKTHFSDKEEILKILKEMKKV